MSLKANTIPSPGFRRYISSSDKLIPLNLVNAIPPTQFQPGRTGPIASSRPPPPYHGQPRRATIKMRLVLIITLRISGATHRQHFQVHSDRLPEIPSLISIYYIDDYHVAVPLLASEAHRSIIGIFTSYNTGFKEWYFSPQHIPIRRNYFTHTS